MLSAAPSLVATPSAVSVAVCFGCPVVSTVFADSSEARREKDSQVPSGKREFVGVTIEGSSETRLGTLVRTEASNALELMLGGGVD